MRVALSLRRSTNEELNAAARKLARMIYFSLNLQRRYVDPGPDHLVKKHQNRILKRWKSASRQLGYTPIKAA